MKNSGIVKARYVYRCPRYVCHLCNRLTVTGDNATLLYFKSNVAAVCDKCKPKVMIQYPDLIISSVSVDE